MLKNLSKITINETLIRCVLLNYYYYKSQR